MVDKISFLHCRLESEIKRKLRQKADELNLDLTEFIKKVARDDIVFVDTNLRKLFDVISLEAKKRRVADSNTKYN